MNSNIKFSENLIKGKVAEVIFEQMFRESGKFTILKSGYEYIFPELAQYKQLPRVELMLQNIKDIPDFILISDDKRKVYLVEVKYRTNLVNKEILKMAEKTLKAWNHSCLFVASPDGFYFGPCNTIVNNGGKIELFKWINNEIQNEYLKLLKKF